MNKDERKFVTVNVKPNARQELNKLKYDKGFSSVSVAIEALIKFYRKYKEEENEK